jgi:uncharacterized protein with GYD domain
MQTYIMLTRLAPDAVRAPRALEELERKVAEHIRASCPNVEWIGSYAVLGPYDYVDLFRAPDLDTATKVSTLVRSYGHAQTETWAATEWDHYKEVVRALGEKATKPAG